MKVIPLNKLLSIYRLEENKFLNYWNNQ